MLCIVCMTDCLLFHRLKIKHDSHEFILEFCIVANSYHPTFNHYSAFLPLCISHYSTWISYPAFLPLCLHNHSTCTCCSALLCSTQIPVHQRMNANGDRYQMIYFPEANNTMKLNSCYGYTIYVTAIQCTIALTLCINVSWRCGEPVSCVFGHLAMSLLLHCPKPTTSRFPLLAGWAPRLPRWILFPQDPHTPPPHLPLQLLPFCILQHSTYISYSVLLPLCIFSPF